MKSYAPLAIVDAETIRLEPADNPCQAVVWELALNLATPDSDIDGRYLWQFEVDAGLGNARSLDIGRWHERRWPEVQRWSDGTEDDDDWETRIQIAIAGIAPGPDDTDGLVIPRSHMSEWAAHFSELTWGTHLVGAVPGFDDRRLDDLLRYHGACPGWHYHLIDVETLTVGYLSARAREVVGIPQQADKVRDLAHLVNPPWDSDDLARAIGIDPSAYERHTAMGDVDLATAMYRTVVPAPPSADEWPEGVDPPPFEPF